jgi:hypothetical protein
MDEDPPLPGDNLTAMVAAFFAERGVPVAPVDGDPSVLIMDYRGEHGAWRCIAQVDEPAQTFVFSSLLDVDVADGQWAAVGEFLHRATAGLVIGNFDVDLDRGDISFRTSIDVEGDRLSPALLTNLVMANLIVADHYLPGLWRVATGEATAKEEADRLDRP